jgi:hypothetical protein
MTKKLTQPGVVAGSRVAPAVDRLAATLDDWRWVYQELEKGQFRQC